MKRGTLDEVLDRCLQRLLVEGATLEDCLESYPEHAAELEPLLQMALATNEALDFSPGEELKARLRYQLRLEMARVEAPRRRPFLSWQPRWAMVIAIVLALVLAGGGTVLAADSSMPGTPLYAVKLATERVRVALARTDVKKAEVYAALMDRRVRELEHVMAKGNAQQVQVAIQRLRERQQDMMTRLALVRKAVAAREAVSGVSPGEPSPDVAGKTPATLKEPTTPPLEPKPSAQELQPQTTVARRATSVATISPDDLLKLRTLIRYYVIHHPAKLRELWEKAPDAYKPVIQRMIIESLSGYRKFLEELKRRADAAAEGDTSGETDTSGSIRPSTESDASGGTAPSDDTAVPSGGTAPSDDTAVPSGNTLSSDTGNVADSGK